MVSPGGKDGQYGEFRDCAVGNNFTAIRYTNSTDVEKNVELML